MVDLVVYKGEPKKKRSLNNLLIGNHYKVKAKQSDDDGHTSYILEGQNGSFDSSFFEKVGETKNSLPDTFLAYSHVVPTVGRSCQCKKLVYVNHSPTLKNFSIAKVQSVNQIGYNIYKVHYDKSIYIVEVQYAS